MPDCWCGQSGASRVRSNVDGGRQLRCGDCACLKWTLREAISATARVYLRQPLRRGEEGTSRQIHCERMRSGAWLGCARIVQEYEG